jgi:hypothetical protein
LSVVCNQTVETIYRYLTCNQIQNIMISRVLFVILALSLASCVNLNKVFTSEYAEASLHLPGTIESIDFIDRRKNVYPGDIELPVFSHPSQLLKHQPELSAVHKTLLSDLFRRNFDSNSTNSYVITVEVIEGLKEFSASFVSETEKVRVGFKITLSSGDKTFVAETSGEYFVKSADAKYKRFEELYQKALQTVAFNALKNFKSKLGESRS